MENHYVKNPLAIALFDPALGSVVKTYFLLGPVPRSVMDAARRENRTQHDKSVLRDFYGPAWKEKLSEIEAPAAAAIEARYQNWTVPTGVE